MDTPTEDLAQLIARAEHLTQQITDQAARDQESFNAGYREAMHLCRAIFDHGVDIGFAQAINRITNAQARLAAHLTNGPSHDELELTRAEPGNLWRYLNGHETEPSTYTAAYLRRGGREYQGGPVHPEAPSDPWDTLPRTTA